MKPVTYRDVFKKALSQATLASLLAMPALSYGLQALTNEEMAEVSGAGLALAADNFRFQMAPTSYIEITGRSTALSNWERGDLRYYGASWTGGQIGAGTGTTFREPGVAGNCNQNDPVGCPVGVGAITNFASVFNPYVFRVFEYEGFDFQGTYRQGANMPSVLELIGPSKTDNWRWGFWGEIEVDRGGANPGLLQSQTIINGSPTTIDGRPAVIRYMRTQQGTVANPSQNGSFGIIYESALSGDFRFSVGQTGNSPNQREWVPEFNANEGVYFRNVDAFIPIGRMHYQTLNIDVAGTSGDFVVRLTPIGNNPNIYNEFYCGNTNGGACATSVESVDPFGNSVLAIASPNEETQGYVRWGDFNDIGNFAAGPTGNGIMFADSSGQLGAPNPGRNNAPMGHMGVSSIEGLRIQSLTLTTLGAGASGP